MGDKPICQSSYKHGNLIYTVTITKDSKYYDWEKEETVQGEKFFVKYVEETLPSRNSVGGFDTLAEALDWVDRQFGKLDWKYM